MNGLKKILFACVLVTVVVSQINATPGGPQPLRTRLAAYVTQKAPNSKLAASVAQILQGQEPEPKTVDDTSEEKRTARQDSSYIKNAGAAVIAAAYAFNTASPIFYFLVPMATWVGANIAYNRLVTPLVQKHGGYVNAMKAVGNQLAYYANRARNWTVDLFASEERETKHFNPQTKSFY